MKKDFFIFLLLCFSLLVFMAYLNEGFFYLFCYTIIVILLTLNAKDFIKDRTFLIKKR